MNNRCLLYYITDRSQFPGDDLSRRRALLDKVVEAASAGVDFIQLREKGLGTRDLEKLAREAVAVVCQNQLSTNHYSLTTRLLINSRTDVAFVVGADGIHLRSDDISPAEARSIWRLCGAGTLAREMPVIATSCHTKSDVFRAASEGADFAVFAPVFEKRDHPGDSPAGLAALREACQAKIPVLALGGVTLENAAACMEAGAAGIAAIRLFQENEVEDVVRVLRTL